MIVDAQQEGYWSLAEKAESEGFTIRYAGSDREALRLAQEERAALWLVNQCLPDMRGLELCRLLRLRQHDWQE